MGRPISMLASESEDDDSSSSSSPAGRRSLPISMNFNSLGSHTTPSRRVQFILPTDDCTCSRDSVKVRRNAVRRRSRDQWYSKEECQRFKDEEQSGEHANSFERAKACRKNLVKSILHQQYETNKLGISDPKGLQKLSRACSKSARGRAREEALQIEREVHNDDYLAKDDIGSNISQSPRSVIPEHKKTTHREWTKKSAPRNLLLLRKPAPCTERQPTSRKHKPVSALTA